MNRVDRNRRSKRDKGVNGNEFSASSFPSQHLVSCYFSIDSAHIRLTVHILIEHSWKRRDRMIYEYDVYASSVHKDRTENGQEIDTLSDRRLS